MINYKYSHCPKCGKKADKESSFIKCTGCGKSTYLHSFSTGSIFVIKGGKVMMAKRADEPLKGAWDIPGGFLHYGEDPRVGAIRELKEETGLDVKIIDILGIYMDEYMHQGETLPTLNCMYIGEIKSGKQKPSDDVSELKWLNIKKSVPNVGFSMVQKGLKDLKKWHEENENN